MAFFDPASSLASLGVFDDEACTSIFKVLSKVEGASSST